MFKGLHALALLVAIARVWQVATAGQSESLFLSPEQACQQYIQRAGQLEEGSANPQVADPQGVIDASRGYLTSAFACLLYQRLGLVAEQENNIDGVRLRLKALPRPATHLGSRLFYCTIEKTAGIVRSTARIKLLSEQFYGLIGTLSELWGLEGTFLASVQVIKRLLEQQRRRRRQQQQQSTGDPLDCQRHDEAVQLEVDSLRRDLIIHEERIAQLHVMLESANLDLISLGLLCHFYHELRGFLWAYTIPGETAFQKAITELRSIGEANLAEPETWSHLQAAIPESVEQREDALQILRDRYKRMLWRRLEAELAQECSSLPQEIGAGFEPGEDLNARLQRIKVGLTRWASQTIHNSDEFSRLVTFWLRLDTSEPQISNIANALRQFVGTDYKYLKTLTQRLQLQLELTLSVGHHLDSQLYRSLDQVLRGVGRAIQCAQDHPELSIDDIPLEYYQDLAGGVERHAYLIYPSQLSPLPLLCVRSKGPQRKEPLNG